MRSFQCEFCNEVILDRKGAYVSSCEHYPKEMVGAVTKSARTRTTIADGLVFDNGLGRIRRTVNGA